MTDDSWWEHLDIGDQLVARGAETANTGHVVGRKAGGYLVRWNDSAHPEGGEESFVSFHDLKAKNVEPVQ